MNTIDTILHKYMRQFRLMDGNRYYHIDAIELAFRLALDELAEFIPSTSSTELVALQKDQLADLQAELERLQTATNAEVAELRQQLAQLDTDNAALIRRNKELSDDLKHARLDRQETAFHTISATITDHPNGTAVSIQPAHALSPISNSMWTDPDSLTLLDDVARDWWIGVAAGRHQWRSVPKPVQLRMVRHILSFGPETGPMKMTEFDAIKPNWMPGSGSHTKTLNLSWSQLNDWSVEL